MRVPSPVLMCLCVTCPGWTLSSIVGNSQQNKTNVTGDIDDRSQYETGASGVVKGLPATHTKVVTSRAWDTLWTHYVALDWRCSPGSLVWARLVAAAGLCSRRACYEHSKSGLWSRAIKGSYQFQIHVLACVPSALERMNNHSCTKCVN